MKTEVDIIILIPIARLEEQIYATSTIKDIEVYYHRRFHIIFIDDSKEFIFKDFKGTNYTTIWSGGEKRPKKKRGKFPVFSLDTLIPVVNVGLKYSYENFKFDFLQYMDSDTVIVNEGLDLWLYEMREKYEFDFLGVLDQYSERYYKAATKNFLMKIFYRAIIQRSIGKVIYEVDEEVTNRFPVIFFAFHFYSYKAVEQIVNVAHRYPFLMNVQIMRMASMGHAESFMSTIVRLLGLNMLIYGVMPDEHQKHGSAKPPFFGAYDNMCKTHAYTLEEIRKEFKIIHRLEGLCDLSASEARSRLDVLREDRNPSIKN